MNTRLNAFVRHLANGLIRWRVPILLAFVLATVALGWSATHLRADARFEKTIPRQHAFMQAFLHYEPTFGGANTVVVALVSKQGDIFNRAFLERLKAVTDDVFFIDGVKRESVTSLWTPRVRFVEITEQGFAGGSVIRSGFTGSPEDLATVRANTEKSGEIGHLVSNDLHGALVQFELQDETPGSRQRLDYEQVAAKLEALRAKYADAQIDVHIVGFAKVIGDIGEGTRGVLLFFAAAGVLTTVLLRLYARSWALTWRAFVVAVLPVVWLLGVLPLIGLGIDPLSILVPYLLFTIGVSHAVQMTSAWSRSVRAGAEPADAAREAFAALFVPGTLALLTNAIGFLVIMLVDIDMVRELGIMASIGVSLMILTNKVLLPVVLSFGHARHAPAARASAPTATSLPRGLAWVTAAAQPRGAAVVIAISALLAAWGHVKGSHVRIGDQGQGMPEFFADARYNRDAAAILKSFSLGSELLSVYVAPPLAAKGAEVDTQICLRPDVADYVDALDAHLRDVPGVSTVIAYPHYAAMINAGWNEGNIKWQVISDNAAAMGQASNQLISDGTGLVSPNCDAMQVLVFAADHDSETIQRLVAAVQGFERAHENAQQNANQQAPARLVLGGGNLGVMAATNEAVAAAEPRMLAAIFVSLAVLCLLTFRDLTGMLVIILPLALVSLLCNALMTLLGIGLKVSTLPVVTLGVGVGVDYGIYLYERLKHHRQDGLPLARAWALALHERGRAVLFTATTMSVGVGSWAFSALKFQADMGLLLAFMFLVNVLGAMLLLPALACALQGLAAWRGRPAAHPAPVESA